MSKQISVKSMRKTNMLHRMYREAQTYLENIGFSKTPLISITAKQRMYRMALFNEAGEKVMVEYEKDQFEEILKLSFSPMEITFVYDILLMRFNQMVEDDSVLIMEG